MSRTDLRPHHSPHGELSRHLQRQTGMDMTTDNQPRPSATGDQRTRPPVIAAMALIGLVLLGGAVWVLTRNDDTIVDGNPVSEPRDQPAASAPAADTATVRVRIEKTEGIFVEGFEVGLRFETADGDVIHSALWSDIVNATKSPDIDAYYTTVFTQSVPAAPITVSAEANVGIGPAPSVPDLDGPLPCSVELDLAPGADQLLEVSFDDATNCLRPVEPESN